MQWFFALFSFCLLAAINLRAAPIVITGSGGSGKEAISLRELRGNGALGALFRATLESDLKRSGWFEPRNEGYSSLRVAGVAEGGNATLNTNLEVVWDKGRFGWNERAASPLEARRLAHRLNDEIVKRVLGKQGMASTRIVMVGKHDGSDLYICDADGQGLMRLTQDRVICLSPYWDPQGDNIYYTSYLRGFPCIYRVPAAGGTRQPLAQFTGLNTGGAISPNNIRMALILSLPGNPELYILNLSTRNLTRLTNTPRASEASPCWSPDGESIAYVSDVSGQPQIYLIDANNKTPRRLTYRGSENVAPSWGTNGRITYCTRQNGYQVAVIDPATGQSEVLTSGPDHEDPSWAADGRHIICSRNEGGGRAIPYILDTMGDPALALFSHQGKWVSPEWSSR